MYLPPLLRILCKTALIFLFLPLPLFCPSGAGAAEDSKARNLQGISGFQLVVEKPTEDALQAGVTEEAVKNQVGAIFKAYLPQVVLDAKEGPSLYVRVLLYKRKSDNLFYGMINVAVDRPVIVLSPPGDFPAFSQVWENSMVFSGGDPLLSTYGILSRLLNLLVEDFKKANR